MTFVYRAPMRSRREDLDAQGAIERALAHRLCGFGDDPSPQASERFARRVDRFAAAPDGSLVWTRDGDGLYWLGRLVGPYFYDTDGESVDLVHVRQCVWREQPVLESHAPRAVIATFARGGRNFQQIHDADVGAASEKLWD